MGAGFGAGGRGRERIQAKVETLNGERVLRFEYDRRLGAGLTYRAVKSATLAPGSWVPMKSRPEVTRLSAEWEHVVHREPLDAKEPDRLFGMVELQMGAR